MSYPRGSFWARSRISPKCENDLLCRPVLLHQTNLDSSSFICTTETISLESNIFSGITVVIFSIQNKEEAKKLIINALAAGRQALFEPEAKALVSAWGIPVSKSVMVEEEADVAIKSKDPPLALKVVSQDILHKREFGG